MIVLHGHVTIRVNFSHGNRGLICVFPLLPIPISVPNLESLPFSWDFHGIANPIANSIHMVMSNRWQTVGKTVLSFVNILPRDPVLAYACSCLTQIKIDWLIVPVSLIFCLIVCLLSCVDVLSKVFKTAKHQGC